MWKYENIYQQCWSSISWEIGYNNGPAIMNIRTLVAKCAIFKELLRSILCCVVDIWSLFGFLVVVDNS